MKQDDICDKILKLENETEQKVNEALEAASRKLAILNAKAQKQLEALEESAKIFGIETT